LQIHAISSSQSTRKLVDAQPARMIFFFFFCADQRVGAHWSALRDAFADRARPSHDRTPSHNAFR